VLLVNETSTPIIAPTNNLVVVIPTRPDSTVKTDVCKETNAGEASVELEPEVVGIQNGESGVNENLLIVQF